MCPEVQQTSALLPYSVGDIRRFCRRITSLHPSIAIRDSHYVVHRLAIHELRPMQEVTEHSHSHFEAFILLDGLLEHLVEANVRQFEAGSVILHTPLIKHASPKSSHRCLKLVVDFNIYPTSAVGPVFRWAYCPDMVDDAMALMHEVAAALPGWNDRVYFRLATLISRLLALVDTAPHPPITDDSAPDIAGKVDQFMRSHLTEPLTLQDVADAVGLSERSLMRHFRRLTGTTVHAYLAQLRMDQAGTLLLEQPDVPLHEICLQVGIPDASYFVRLFHHHHQHTPHQHRAAELVRKRRKR